MDDVVSTTATVAPGTCPACAATNPVDARYCEACGAELAPCLQCGGSVAEDGYCTQCGAPAVKPRDHLREQPADWVTGVSDRGVRHHRNEDALALASDTTAGGRAVLVVCDGVSSSTDSDVASLAAARAARDVLVVPPAVAATEPGDGSSAGPAAPSGDREARVAATTDLLTAAADAAAAAVAGTTVHAGSPSPPSCTFVAAVLDGDLLVVGWVGDSRAYWLPDDGDAVALTVDDSWAAEQMALGVERAVAESGPQAHAITRWLGVDAPDHTPHVAHLVADSPGWVLVCSDGLWNYCSEAGDLAALVRDRGAAAAGPLGLALDLVAYANGQGGQDNITVALARVGATSKGKEGPTDGRVPR